MPFFDGANLGDPEAQSALGYLSSLAGSFADSAMPSALPTPMGAVLGHAAQAGRQGQFAGAQQAQAYRKGQLETGSAAVGLDQALIVENALRKALNMPLLSASDLQNGKIGTASPLFGNATVAPSAPSASGGETTPPAGVQANGSADPQNSLGNALITKLLGFAPTDYQRAKIVAAMLPDGPAKVEAERAAAKLAGVDVTVSQRAGESTSLFNPETGQYEEQMRNPNLTPDIDYDPKTKTAAPVTGVVGAIGQVESAKERAAAQYRPITVYDQAGNEYTVPASQLSGAGAKSAPQGAAPAPVIAPAKTPAPLAATGPGAAPAPNTPVQNSAAGIPTKLDDFLGQLGPTYKPPARPNAPPGALMGEPGKGTEEIQKADGERLEQYSKEAAGGQKVYTNLEQLYGIMGRGLSTGNMTGAATNLTNYARQLGMSSLIPKNFDPNDAGAFNKLATDLVFAQLKQIGGRPMVSEIEGLKQANPNTSLTPAANVEILNNILADQRWRDARSDLGRQYMARFGSLGDFDARFNEKYPEVATFNKITDAAAKAGWKMPGSPGTPSGGPAAIPDAALKSLKPGVITHFSNGQSWMLGSDGKPERVK